jgi:phosphatidylglycerol:prolipoprotein diacylglycerol transferase
MPMTFPVYLPVGTLRLHPHFVFETAAYVIAFRLYLWLRGGRETRSTTRAAGG